MTEERRPQFLEAAALSQSGIFGLPSSFAEAKVVFIPVPWEATASYGKGTVHGPAAILAASAQIDLFDLDVISPEKLGLHCLPISPEIFKLNDQASRQAQAVIDVMGDLKRNPELKDNLTEVNQLSEHLNTWVKEQTLAILKQNKIPSIIGGDHSTPFGAFQAAAEQCGDFGILHFDAHSDLRKSYLGFKYSHASILYNAISEIPQVTQLIQIGIRDFCEVEYEFAQAHSSRVKIFYDQHLHMARAQGESLLALTEKILSSLPEKVWVTFDIDALQPSFCPNTGTPVPGGLDYSDAIYILRALARSGRKIIGFDLQEVAPPLDQDAQPIVSTKPIHQWDANVGMRILYKLSALALASQGVAQFRNLEKPTL